MHMGLLEMEVFPPNGYSPAAFDMDGTDRLPLVKAATLEAAIFVKWDRSDRRAASTCPPA